MMFSLQPSTAQQLSPLSLAMVQARHVGGLTGRDLTALSKYCMMFSLQPSNAQQLSPLSEIMILPVALQYSTRALIIHSMFLKRHFSKWRSESQNGRQMSCSLDV